MATLRALRELITARAGGACEYCRLLQAPTGVTFHIDHIYPRSLGGRTLLSNLALSCPACNLLKGDQTTAPDSRGQLQPLFNPRLYEQSPLGWHFHFLLDHASGIIAAKTSIAEATITALNMNDPDAIIARQFQIRAGVLG